MTKCPTCWKPLKRATSRHKCHHGVWCGIYGEPQLTYRSRTCTRCNDEIGSVAAVMGRETALSSPPPDA